MGQKVNPIGYRLGVNKDWDSKWYADKKDFGKTLNTDLRIRKYLDKNLKDAAVASITIERKKREQKLQSILLNQVLLLDVVEKILINFVKLYQK